jgi:phage gp36-like protein
MIRRYDEQQLIQLTDRAEEPTGMIDAAILSAALDEASALINSYVARRYKTPVDPAPILLRNLCAAIAYFDLHRGRHAEETRAAYDDALRTLANISNGSVVLEVAGDEPQSAAARVSYDESHRQFSRKRGDW